MFGYEGLYADLQSIYLKRVLGAWSADAIDFCSRVSKAFIYKPEAMPKYKKYLTILINDVFLVHNV